MLLKLILDLVVMMCQIEVVMGSENLLDEFVSTDYFIGM
jgi:hypothetical protein